MSARPSSSTSAGAERSSIARAEVRGASHDPRRNQPSPVPRSSAFADTNDLCRWRHCCRHFAKDDPSIGPTNEPGSPGLSGAEGASGDCPMILRVDGCAVLAVATCRPRARRLSVTSDHRRNRREEQTMNSRDGLATVDASLRLVGGLESSERENIVTQFASLDARLRSFRENTVVLLLTVKERNTPSQRTTLEAQIAGQRRIVATSSDPLLTRALNEVRDDLVRQITDAKTRTEPRNNRRLRSTES